MNPSFSARFCALVVSHEAAMPHKPAKRALDNPPARQYRKTLGRFGTLYYFHFELGPLIHDPLLKGFSGIAAVYPELAQLGKPSFNALENLLSPVPLRTTGRSHDHPQQQAQGI